MRMPNRYTPQGPMALMWINFAAELLDNFLLTREFGSASACGSRRVSGMESGAGTRTGGTDDLPFLQNCKHEI
jgi:hypothetical protein